MPSATPTRAIAFLDRDGVLNVDTGYLVRPQDVVWVPGAAAAIRLLNRTGHRVVVVTNQSGIARGLYTPAEVDALHRWMAAQLAAAEAHIDAFFHCPHHPAAPLARYRTLCDCRKPAPGMLLRAFAQWPTDRQASFLIGDQERDIDAARRAGITGHLFAEGENLETRVRAILADRDGNPA